MKVCILSHCFPPSQGAAELYIGNIAEELTKEGIEVVVITSALDPALPAYEEQGDVKIYRFTNKFPPMLNNYGFMFGLMPTLRKVFEKERFNILQSEHVFPVPEAGKFAREKNIPHIAVIEGISKVSLYSKMVYLTHKFVLPRAHFDVLVSWSRFLSEEFLKSWGIDDSKIRTIPGGVDTERFGPAIDGSNLRKELLDHRAEKLIFTAKPMNYTNVLGLSYIIRAMPEIIKEYKTCKLIIGGAGRRLPQVEKLVDDLDLQEHVKFVGWIQQEKIPEYYAASDVVVNSTIYRHAGSIKVLESLASGKPNVLCNIECLPGENSFPTEDIAVLVKPGDEGSMAKGILRLLNDEKLGAELGKNARNFIKDNFSIKQIARYYKKLYAELRPVMST